jgi:hypothetical protein
MPASNYKAGTTKLVDGVREGIDVVRNRKNWYKQTGINRAIDLDNIDY